MYSITSESWFLQKKRRNKMKDYGKYQTIDKEVTLISIDRNVKGEKDYLDLDFEKILKMWSLQKKKEKEN